MTPARLRCRGGRGLNARLSGATPGLTRIELAIASGERPKSEQLGLGDEEFQPWILGPVL